MKEYVDEMLHLASDIVEGLLTVKDSGGDVDPELNLLIQRLAVLSDSHMVMDAPSSLAAEVVDAHVPEMAAVSSDEPDPVSVQEPEPARETGCDLESEADEIAASAEFEEEADADADCVPEPSSVCDDEAMETESPVEDSFVDYHEDIEIIDNLGQGEEEVHAGEVEPEVTVVENSEDLPAMAETESVMTEGSEAELSETDIPGIKEPEAKEAASAEAELPVTQDEIVEEAEECEEEVVRESAPESECVTEAHQVVYEVVEAPKVTPRTIFPADLRRAFSLNDIFFYQRTLFGGSSERFNETLQAAAGMSDSGQLRQYLSEVQRVNVKSDTAKEFIAVIATFLDD